MLPSAEFWISIGHSFGKITLGFAAAFAAGIFFGSLAFRFRLLQELLEPLMLLAKSIPVASFVILALIWIGSSGLSVFISFLVVFPILYVNTIAGLESTDPKLREMALVFHVSLPRRIRFIYLPALMPYLISSCKIALGMSWKSGIAAEVIGVPSHTIGENLYMAKIYLATPDIFAWTIVIILVSALFEKFFLQLIIWMKKENEQYQPENACGMLLLCRTKIPAKKMPFLPAQNLLRQLPHLFPDCANPTVSFLFSVNWSFPLIPAESTV